MPRLVHLVILAGVTLALAAGAAAAQDQPICVGDCSGDGTITIDELLRGVRIALGEDPLDACPGFDCAANGAVSVACLVQAVAGALTGCQVARPAGPMLEGPITTNGTPFVAAAGFDLGQVGYTQVEYFMAGTAQAYVADLPLPADGRIVARPDAEAAYRTRLLIYRPIDPARFNGTVYVEWLNVSGGLDSAPDWITGHTEMIRSGAVWVGVSAQSVGIEGGGGGVVSLPLKVVNPARYGSLTHPGDSFSYDIYTQAARAVRGHGTLDLFADLTPERVLAVGESQSAFRLVTYINAVHRLAGAYDGFLVHSRASGGAQLSQAPQPAIALPSPAVLRTDLDVPVMTFQTETDVISFGAYAARQPDTDRLRLWEVAGTAHADVYTLVTGGGDLGTSPDIDDLIITAEPIPGILTCASPINAGPQHWVLKAALAALDRWVRDDTAPPTAPRIELTATTPPQVARDARGNALGGIRTPQLDVPLATFSGEGQTGSTFCALFGTTVPFDEATLAALYPTRQDYVDAFHAATDAAVAAGFILPADAALMKANAAQEP